MSDGTVRCPPSDDQTREFRVAWFQRPGEDVSMVIPAESPIGGLLRFEGLELELQCSACGATGARGQLDAHLDAKLPH